MSALKAADIPRIRIILRDWGSYGPTSYGYGWTPLPVDALTDDEVLVLAEQIATRTDDDGEESPF